MGTAATRLMLTFRAANAPGMGPTADGLRDGSSSCPQERRVLRSSFRLRHMLVGTGSVRVAWFHAERDGHSPTSVNAHLRQLR